MNYLFTLGILLLSMGLFAQTAPTPSPELIKDDPFKPKGAIDGISEEVQLEEIVIETAREPLIKESFGGLHSCSGSCRWRCIEMNLHSGLGGVQMTNGSSATFFNLLKIDR